MTGMGFFRVYRLCLNRFVRTNWRTCADQHAVALRIVYAPHRWPKFVATNERHRKCSLRTCIGLVPCVGAYHGNGMWRRSEERSVGQEGVMKCDSGWTPGP